MTSFHLKQPICKLHSNQMMTMICFHEKCKKRILCPKCYKLHNPNHAQYIQSIDDFKEFDMASQLEKLDKYIHQTNNLYKRIMADLELGFEKARKEFDKILQEIKEKVKIQMQLLSPQGQESLAKLRSDIKNIFELSNSKHDIPEHNDEYILNKYIDLKQAIREYEILTESSLENHCFSLIEKIKTNLQNFQKSFLFPENLLAPFPEDPVFSNEDENISPENMITETKLFATGKIYLRSLTYVEHFDIIACGDGEGNVLIWDTEYFTELFRMQVHHSPITVIQFSPTQRIFLTASHDKTIAVCKWTRLGLRKIKTLVKHDDEVWSLLIIEKKGILISGGDDANLYIWDLKKLKNIALINTYGKSSVRADLVYIETENLLAVGFYDAKLALYNLTTREEVCYIETNMEREHVLSMCYLERRGLLAVGCGESYIQLYKIKEHTISYLKEIEMPDDTPRTLLPVNNETSLLVSNFSSFIYRLSLDNSSKLVAGDYLEIAETISMILIPKKRMIAVGDWQTGIIVILNY